LPTIEDSKLVEAGNVPIRTRQIRNKPAADRIGNLHKQDWYGVCLFLHCEDRRSGMSHNHVGLQCNKFFGEDYSTLWVTGCPTMVNLQIAAVHPPQFAEFFV
jgi:hypothetical protein